MILSKYSFCYFIYTSILIQSLFQTPLDMLLKSHMLMPKKRQQLPTQEILPTLTL